MTLNTPFLIRPEAYHQLAERHQTHLDTPRLVAEGQSPQAIDWGQYYHQREGMTIDDDGIAHIHVYGPLIDNPEPYLKRYGDLTDYRDLQTEVQLASTTARAILFHHESPGGTVAGLAETNALIESLTIPTAAFTSEWCCSASYSLACSTDLIIARPSAEVGSIGTIIRWMDISEYYRQMGAEGKVLTNQSATLKSSFFLGQLTPEQEAHQLEQLEAIGLDFQAHVLGHRPQVDTDEVFRAGHYTGQRALDLGLIDFIANQTDARDTLLNM